MAPTDELHLIAADPPDLAPASAPRRRWTRLLARAAALGAPAAPAVLDLGATTARSVRARPGLVVRCVDGCVWVTLPADPGDHVLERGSRFVASGRGRLVVTAFAPSRIALT